MKNYRELWIVKGVQIWYTLKNIYFNAFDRQDDHYDLKIW